VDPAVLADVLAAAWRAPAAGNAFSVESLVLDTPGSVAAYWDVTLPAGPRRATFGWPGLLLAPVLVIPTVSPGAYLERYGAPDKAATGLGDSAAAWPVPYWFVDGGAAVMAMLVAAADAGLGSLLFGQFGFAPAIADRFGIPGDRVALGTLALGHPDPTGRSRSASAERGRIDPAAALHFGRWGAVRT
jgi:nitroreductase